MSLGKKEKRYGVVFSNALAFEISSTSAAPDLRMSRSLLSRSNVRFSLFSWSLDNGSVCEEGPG